MNPLATLIFLVIAQLHPLRGPQTSKGHTESVEDRKARYESIASDLAFVLDTSASLPYGTSRGGKLQAAALLLGVAEHESHFTLAVDKGLKGGRGDNGRSLCLAQIKFPRPWESRTREGWSAQDILEDRTKCFRSALRIMAGSMGACRALGPAHGLSAYATGRCQDEPKGQLRLATAAAIRSRMSQIAAQLAKTEKAKKAVEVEAASAQAASPAPEAASKAAETSSTSTASLAP